MDNNKSKKIYYGLDLIKLLLAILVVLVHVSGPGRYTPAVNVLVNYMTRVTVFFIASGFFFARGLLKNADNPSRYFKKYFIRVLEMYLFWTIFTTPWEVMVINVAHGDFSVIKKIIYYFRTVIFCGSLGIYWYVLALVYNSVVLYIVYVRKWEKYIIPIAILLWMIGMFYDSQFNDRQNLLYMFMHAVFGSNRTFWSTGLIYMLIGYMFALNEEKLKFNPMLLFLFYLLTIYLRYLESTKTPFTGIIYLVQAPLLFLFSINIKCDFLKGVSKDMRKLSTVIYLVQFPFLLLFDFYLHKPLWYDFTITLAFCVTSYFILKKLLPEKWFGIMFGN